MKRLFVVIAGLLISPAFAEVAPQYLYDSIEFVDDGIIAPNDVDENENSDAKTESEKPAVTQIMEQRMAQSGRTSGRTTLSRTGAESGNAVQSSRGVSARNTTSRTTTPRTTRTASTRSTNSRSASVTPRSSTQQRSTVARATIRLNTDTAPLYNPNNISNDAYYNANNVTSRVSIATRNPSIRASGGSLTTASSVSNVAAANDLDALAEMTDFCKAQYAACMDNYCNVLDDNEGRCSCSANITNYAKTEEALIQAEENLQEVAQQIQYIGLSAEDIETLFTETEAELQLSRPTDTTKLKSDLDKIKKMIIDVQTGKSTTTSNGLALDLSGLLSFSFDNIGFDLSSLTGFTQANTSSISNQRGENLYKTGSARCKASVLNTCANQGVDISLITNYYDLQIDKDCLAYERALNEANSNMTATIRNAKSVLQKARLMVAQNKNQYDLRGCVEALDSCMTSDFVCGDDYESCLDPTGKYIVDGQIVVGSLAANVKNTWNFGNNQNAWDNGTLATYISETLKTNKPPKTPSDNLSEFLQYKIGYHDDDDGRNYGMCVSVLNQCQNYTYDKEGKYLPDNMVISEFLSRVLMQIKASQDTILAEYAESCILDVKTCLITNGYSTDSTKQTIAQIACKSIIDTCSSLNNIDSTVINATNGWVTSIMQN